MHHPEFFGIFQGDRKGRPGIPLIVTMLAQLYARGGVGYMS